MTANLIMIKKPMIMTCKIPAGLLAGALLGGLVHVTAWSADLSTDDGPEVMTAAGTVSDGGPKVAVAGADGDNQPGPATKHQQFLFRYTAPDDGRSSEKVPWLGVGVTETTEPLTAQLSLKPGEGLVVTYVATNSPAAPAGLQKNDVLVELDGQMLVDPTQLRKLVQMHADGDTVEIEFYRAGKKQSATAKLTLRPPEETFVDGESGSFNPWTFPKSSMPFSFGKGDFDFDKGKFDAELRAATDQYRQATGQARKAIEEAMRQMQNSTNGLHQKLEILHQKLGDLAAGGVDLRKDATVIVNNDGGLVRTMAKKDESGTYVVIADPARHLTAHDANGKLLFDGSIDTPEQQQKVPREVWSKVQPMLDQMDQPVPPEGKPVRQGEDE